MADPLQILSQVSEEKNWDLGGPALNSLPTPRWREFVLHYTLGEDGTRGVAYRSYLAAGFKASSTQVASAAVYQLMRDHRIIAAIEEVRTSIDHQARLRMKSWALLGAKAQGLLEAYLDTMTGERLEKGLPPVILGPVSLMAIREALDRAIGRPKQPVEHDIGNRLDSLIKKLAGQSDDQLSPMPSPKALGDGGEILIESGGESNSLTTEPPPTTDRENDGGVGRP